ELGRVTLAKAASTPADPSLGVMEGLRLLAAELGRDRESLLSDTALIVHGTTVATNALLEKKGAVVGMLTTEGHRDIIEMREGLKDDRYNLRMAPPVPLVPRARRIGVRGPAGGAWAGASGPAPTAASPRRSARPRSPRGFARWPAGASTRWPSAPCPRPATPATRSGRGRRSRRACPEPTSRSRPRSC